MKKKIIYFCVGVLLTSLILVAIQVLATAPNPGHDINEIGGVSGMIVMFDTSCPASWTRFSALDSKFAYGGTTYGATGGSSTHTHTVILGASNWGRINVSSDPLYPLPQAKTYESESFSTLPPYLTVIWCKKD